MAAETVWNILRWLHFLALSLWLGGMFFLVAVAARAVHRSMASRALAGEIVGGMLKRLNYLEIFSFLTLLVTSFSSAPFLMGREQGVFRLIVLVSVMGGLTACYAFFLAPKMERLKSGQPGFETLEGDHAVRKQFRQLHRLYARLMGLNLLLAGVTLYVSLKLFC